MKVQSPNHWTAREFLQIFTFFDNFIVFLYDFTYFSRTINITEIIFLIYIKLLFKLLISLPSLDDLDHTCSYIQFTLLGSLQKKIREYFIFCT